MILYNLKADDYFEPQPLEAEDEVYQNGIFQFNITKMRGYIMTHPDQFIIESVTVKDMDSAYSRIDENYIQSVQNKEPIILAEISPRRYNVIDGNHRLEKARKSGQLEINAYRLNAQQHVMFLTTQIMYNSYVEYWNGKVKDLESPGISRL